MLCPILLTQALTRQLWCHPLSRLFSTTKHSMCAHFMIWRCIVRIPLQTDNKSIIYEFHFRTSQAQQILRSKIHESQRFGKAFSAFRIIYEKRWIYLLRLRNLDFSAVGNPRPPLILSTASHELVVLCNGLQFLQRTSTCPFQTDVPCPWTKYDHIQAFLHDFSITTGSIKRRPTFFLIQ